MTSRMKLTLATTDEETLKRLSELLFVSGLYVGEHKNVRNTLRSPFAHENTRGCCTTNCLLGTYTTLD